MPIIKMNGVSSFDIPDTRNISLVVVHVKAKESYYAKANSLISDDYLSAKRNLNSAIAPSFKDKSIWYSIINGKLELLPTATDTEYYDLIEICYQPIQGRLKITDDLPITEDYVDLLVSIAAKFGMEDLGRQDKVNLFAQDIVNELSIFSNYTAIRKQEEGKTNESR